LSEPIQLLSAVRHFQELPHQCEAWVLLQDSLTPEQLERFAARYRGGLTPGLIQLPVPYLSQNDSATDQGRRMCFSSSCAMAAAFLKPGCLAGQGQVDDQYLRLVQRYGDSTDASAQIAALGSLGLRARFRQDGAIEDLLHQLRRGLPCPVGWLHRGPVSAPRGGGHWSVVVGWDPASRQLLMHDPNGEAALAEGGYVITAIGSGQALSYSERNWSPRWQVEGPGSGWWIQLSPAN
jgi:hypothetical protein